MYYGNFIRNHKPNHLPQILAIVLQPHFQGVQPMQVIISEFNIIFLRLHKILFFFLIGEVPTGTTPSEPPSAPELHDNDQKGNSDSYSSDESQLRYSLRERIFGQ